MNIRHLHYLQLILSEGSFAAAAIKAGISQPAVTQAMQSLEAQCGAPLFEKHGRSKRPTRMALALARQGAQIQEQLDQLMLETDTQIVAEPEPGQALRVGMVPTALRLYAGKVEALWRQVSPEGSLKIVCESGSQMLAALRHGQLDLVIAPKPKGHRAEGTRHSVLHTSQPTVHARAGHALLAGPTLKTIAQADWGVVDDGGTPGEVIEQACRSRRLPGPRIRVRCADHSTLLDLVAASDLLCVVPHPVLLEERHRQQLRPLKLREPLPALEMCLFHKTRLAAPRAEAIEAIREALAGRTAAKAPLRRLKRAA